MLCCGDLDFHAGVVFPMPLDLMQLDAPVSPDHDEIRRVERLVRKPQLHGLIRPRDDLARVLHPVQIPGIAGLGLVHGVGLVRAAIPGKAGLAEKLRLGQRAGAGLYRLEKFPVLFGAHCSTPNARKLASCSSSGVSGLPCLRASILQRRLARIFAHQSVPSSHRSSSVNAFSGKASRFTAGVRFRASSTCRITSAGTGKNRRTACVRRIPSRNSASLTSASTSPQVLTSNSNSACAGLGCR